MAPLSVEVYNPKTEKWIKLPNAKPRDMPGSISDNKSNGSREVYMFECSIDDSESTIYRSRTNSDIEIEDLRAVSTTDFEVIKRLRRGEVYEMRVKTDRSQEKLLIRFTHV